VFAGVSKNKIMRNDKVAIKLVMPDGQTLEDLVKTVTAEGSMLQAISTCEFVLKCSTAFTCAKADLPQEVQDVDGIKALAGDANMVGLVTTLANGGDLWEKKNFLMASQRYSLMKDYAHALDCINKLGYVHRDIKPQNLMIHFKDFLGNDPQGVIIDMGVMSTLNAAKAECHLPHHVGTPGYLPPVVFDKSQCNYGVAHWDEYSLGHSLMAIGAMEIAGAGDDALKLQRKMTFVPNDEMSRWPEFIASFKTAKHDTPVCEVNEAGVDINRDKYLASPWKLGNIDTKVVEQGTGYFKQNKDDADIPICPK
jgi:serine/threonine protein kinase